MGGNKVREAFKPRPNIDNVLDVPKYTHRQRARQMVGIVILTALLTSAIAISLSYFAFSQRAEFDFYNKGQIVCFAVNHNCYKLSRVK